MCEHASKGDRGWCETVTPACHISVDCSITWRTRLQNWLLVLINCSVEQLSCPVTLPGTFITWEVCFEFWDNGQSVIYDTGRLSYRTTYCNDSRARALTFFALLAAINIALYFFAEDWSEPRARSVFFLFGDESKKYIKQKVFGVSKKNSMEIVDGYCRA